MTHGHANSRRAHLPTGAPAAAVDRGYYLPDRGLAEPEGYLRTFVDEGEPLAELLGRALFEGIIPTYVARLLRQWSPWLSP